MEAVINGNAPIMIDIIVAVIFLLFISISGKRGLYSCAMSVFVIVLALAIGIFLSGILTEPAFKYVYPKVENSITQKYDKEMEAIEKDKDTPASVFSDNFNHLLDTLGLDDMIQEGSDRITAKTKEVVLQAAAATTYKLVKLVLFGLCTAIGLFVMTIIKNFFGNVADWPIISWVNTLGGMLIGFLECYIIFFLLIKGADLIGIQFFNDISEGTILMDFINSHKDAAELYQIGMDAITGAKDAAIDTAKEAAKNAAGAAADAAKEAAKNAAKDAAQNVVDGLTNE